MADKNLTAQQANDNNTPYWTRYGRMTAPEAAQDLLDRAGERLYFLEALFNACAHDGRGFTLPGYSALGLATILKDIGHDVYDAHHYYCGVVDNAPINPYPGRTGE